MQRGKIVIVEGTSCTGKTTLSQSLEKKGWIVIPEAIRYLEKETNKLGDKASPIPNLQAEEEYYQDQLFRIEFQKILEANEYANKGKNVIIDKSAVATIATARVFEDKNEFSGTFKRAYNKYIEMSLKLKEMGYIECDIFLLLMADYDVICKRNLMRNHVLEGVWTEIDTISTQREVLEKIFNNIIGTSSNIKPHKKAIDTTNLNKEQVLESVIKFINSRDMIKE